MSAKKKTTTKKATTKKVAPKAPKKVAPKAPKKVARKKPAPKLAPKKKVAPKKRASAPKKAGAVVQARLEKGNRFVLVTLGGNEVVVKEGSFGKDDVGGDWSEASIFYEELDGEDAARIAFQTRVDVAKKQKLVSKPVKPEDWEWAKDRYGLD